MNRFPSVGPRLPPDRYVYPEGSPRTGLVTPVGPATVESSGTPALRPRGVSP